MLALLASTVRPERRAGIEDPVWVAPSVEPSSVSRCWPSSTARARPAARGRAVVPAPAPRSVAGRCAPRRRRCGDRVPRGQRLVAGDEPGGYGDPSERAAPGPSSAARSPGYPREYGFARILVVDLPSGSTKTFFYNSAFGRFLLPRRVGHRAGRPRRRSRIGGATTVWPCSPRSSCPGLLASASSPSRRPRSGSPPRTSGCRRSPAWPRSGSNGAPATSGRASCRPCWRAWSFVALRLDVIAIYA